MEEKKVTQYFVNGKEYKSLAEMPADIRALVEGNLPNTSKPNTVDVIVENHFVVSGKKYNSYEEVPEEFRSMLRSHMASGGVTNTTVPSQNNISFQFGIDGLSLSAKIVLALIILFSFLFYFFKF